MYISRHTSSGLACKVPGCGIHVGRAGPYPCWIHSACEAKKPCHNTMSPLHLGVGSSVAQYRRLRTRAGDGPVHSSSAEGWRGGSAGPPPVSNSTSTNSSKPNSNGAYNLKTVTSNGNGPGGSSSSSSGSSGSTLWRTPGAPPRRDPAAAAASTAAAAAAAARLGAMGPAGAAAVAAGAVQVPAAGWGAATGGVQSVRRQAHAGGHSLRGAWRAWLAWMAQLLQYRLMVLFRLPTWGKMLAIILVGLPIVVLGGALLRHVTNLPLGEAAQYAFYVLQNVPGMDVTRFDSVAARSVLIAIHLLSLYTFATLVGLLTEDVRSTVEGIRCGNFPIPARGHTVVLDGSGNPQHLAEVLKQVVSSREVRGGGAFPGCIAVLTTMYKEDVDRLIGDELPGEAGVIVTRTGSALKVSDLERVAAGAAHTVMLLSPSQPLEHLPPAVQQQVTLAALRSMQHMSYDTVQSQYSQSTPGGAQHQQHQHHQRAASQGTKGAARGGAGGLGGRVAGWKEALVMWLLRQGGPGGSRGGGGAGAGAGEGKQHVVVETRSSALGDATRVCEDDPGDPLQPGLAAVFDAVICRTDDASLHIVPVPEKLAGRSFGDIRRQFHSATLCGVLPAAVRPPGGRRGPAYPVASASAASAAAEGAGSMGSLCNDNGGDGGGDGGGGGGRVVFCPPDSQRVRQQDQLVLLADRRGACVPSDTWTEAPAPPDLGSKFDARRSAPRHLVLIAVDSQVSGPMVAALKEFSSPDCAITVISPEPCAGFLPNGRMPSPCGLELHNMVGDPLSPFTVRQARVIAADAVILTGLETLAPEVADAHVVSTALLLQGLLTDPVAAAMAEQEQGGEEDAYSSVASGGSMDEGVRGAVGVEGAAAAAGAGAGAGEGAGGPVVDLERVGTGPGGSGGGGASYQLREEVEEVEGSSAGEERLGGVSGVGAEEGQGKGEGKGRGKGEAGLGSLEAREVDPKFMSFSDDEELSWRLMTGGAAGGGPGGYSMVDLAALLEQDQVRQLASSLLNRRRRRQANATCPRRRPIPTRPLTLVCALNDPRTRTVLQSIASAACYTAAATAAAAVGSMAGATAVTPPPVPAAPAVTPVPGMGGGGATLSLDDSSATSSMDAGAGGGGGGPSLADVMASMDYESGWVDGVERSDGEGSGVHQGGAGGQAQGQGRGQGGGGEAAAPPVVARGMSVEVVEPAALVSGMLAQVGADPRLASGLEDLLDEQGCEVYIKRPDRYGLQPLQRISWGQVCEVVRSQGDDLPHLWDTAYQPYIPPTIIHTAALIHMVVFDAQEAAD